MLARRRLAAFAVSFALPAMLSAQSRAGGGDAAPPAADERLLVAMHAVSSHTILDWVKELASDRFEGRLTGTRSYEAAAAWSADLLASWGYLPAGDAGTYYQRFPNPYTLVLPGSDLVLHVPLAGGGEIQKRYVFEQEYYPGSTSDALSATAEAVYAGYGITAPELGYDDYAGLDVQGKFVVIEPEVPVPPGPDVDTFLRWRPYSFHDYKMRNAAAHGAAGIVYDYFIVNPNAAFVRGLQWVAAGRAVIDDLFAGTGRRHADVVAQIRRTLAPSSFPLGKTLTMKNVTEHHAEGVGSNVVAWKEGADSELKREAIVVGAHLDHLGLNPVLMPGAHDNASGVGVALAVAQALARAGVPLKRSVIVILFGAEEQGVKGSEYYVAHPFMPLKAIKAFVNLESVGRGERIEVGSGRDYPQICAVMERVNERFVHRKLSASTNANVARPRQDAAHFLWAGVPSVSIGTSGAPPLPYPTYHTTRDRWDILTPEIMEDLARIVFLSVVELANQ
ncbi:MAG TPA: M20/M25/M40 family metallo-hydrolase [Vicinamibacterales bacterium]|nr:M20/M25/M40 family metallo-hydrolase [Vicinamibacterales bacterium]HPW20002.1 M20/M25/M40 family metallo-hydrolase [Vicinamibacterales bacterium]